MNAALITTLVLGWSTLSTTPMGAQDAPKVVQQSPPAAAPFEVPVGQALRLEIPRNESLEYTANVAVGFVEASVGRVVQNCTVSPYKRSVLLRRGAQEGGQERAKVEISATGSYVVYELKTRIAAGHLPQAWPAITYDYESTGTKRRRRQNLIGVRAGKPTSSERRDTSNGAPEGARIWREPHYREIPKNTLDMLSSVLMTRTLIKEGLDELSFPMVEKDRLWKVTLSRGVEKRMKLRAGTFDVVEVLLKPEPYQDENIAAEKVDKFKGLFGIHGTIHLWVEKHTGVAVRIQGDIPAGPVTLGVDVILKKFSGTPPEFKLIES